MKEKHHCKDKESQLKIQNKIKFGQTKGSGTEEFKNMQRNSWLKNLVIFLVFSSHQGMMECLSQGYFQFQNHVSRELSKI